MINEIKTVLKDPETREAIMGAGSHCREALVGQSPPVQHTLCYAFSQSP